VLSFIKKAMMSAAVVTVIAGIYSAVHNMPIVTGCLSAECQLEKMAQDGVNQAPTGDMGE
jgi:hypothetical protein